MSGKLVTAVIPILIGRFPLGLASPEIQAVAHAHGAAAKFCAAVRSRSSSNAVSSGGLEDLVSISASTTVYPTDDAILSVLNARSRSENPYTRLSASNLVDQLLRFSTHSKRESKIAGQIRALGPLLYSFGSAKNNLKPQRLSSRVKARALRQTHHPGECRLHLFFSSHCPDITHFRGRNHVALQG